MCVLDSDGSMVSFDGPDSVKGCQPRSILVSLMFSRYVGYHSRVIKHLVFFIDSDESERGVAFMPCKYWCYLND